MTTRKLSRRTVLKGAAASAAAVGATTLFAPAVRAATSVKIGYVTPQSGPLAPFAEADKYVIDTMSKLIAKGLRGAGGDLPIEIVVKDSQSDPNRAAEVAKELIVDDNVNLIVVASTPETTNPVSTVAESEEVPCVSTMAPWQPWYIGRQANPGDPKSWTPFKSTYHYFWGLEDIIAVFSAMWSQLDTNKQVGGLFPNDGDGNAWGDPNVGIAPGLKAAAGFTVHDPGRYQNLNDDFTAQITAFKNAKTDIVTGVVIRRTSRPSGRRRTSRA
jgi:branched-chain amino acid transport system substrate-binding protein